MGRSTETIEIMVSVEPSEHPEDGEFLEDLKFRIRSTLGEVRADYPRRFIDTMGLG